MALGAAGQQRWKRYHLSEDELVSRLERDVVLLDGEDSTHNQTTDR